MTRGGSSSAAYPFAELREDALAHAQRFVAMGLKPGDRVALIAETGAEFAACFFGAVYAGLWPVPLPLPTSFGGREAYVEQLRVMLKSSDPSLFLCPPELLSYAEEAGADRGVPARDWDSLDEIDARDRRASRRPTRTKSPICNIRAARRASRTALP